MFLNDHLTSAPSGIRPVAESRSMLSCLAASVVTMGPVFRLRSLLHPERCPSPLFLPFFRRGVCSRVIAAGRARSAVVREQTGYRARLVSLDAGAHLIIVKIHARDLHCVFAGIKDVSRFSPLPLPPSRAVVCVTALDHRRTQGRYGREKKGVK